MFFATYKTILPCLFCQPACFLNFDNNYVTSVFIPGGVYPLKQQIAPGKLYSSGIYYNFYTSWIHQMSFILPTKPQVGLRVGNFISLFMSHFLKNFTLWIDIIKAVQMMLSKYTVIHHIKIKLNHNWEHLYSK